MTTDSRNEIYELGPPSSFSTLYFVPDWIQQLLDEQKLADNEAQNVDIDHDSEEDQNMNALHPMHCHSSTDTLHQNPYGLRSKNKKIRSEYRQNAMSDYETMAFVGLRDLLGIDPVELRNLYAYNHCEYQTFEAAINNRNVEYSTVMNKAEFGILYRIFGGVQGLTSWMDVCEELGFAQFFGLGEIKAFFHELSNVELRATHGLPELRFFMQLVIFYWDRQHHALNGHSCKFAYFWTQCLIRVIKFISEFAVGQHVAVFSASTQQWMSSAVIIELSGADQQLCVQYQNAADGKNEQRWYSYFSPCVAPINLMYQYAPNRSSHITLPCIAAVVDGTLDNLATYHLPVRDTSNKARKATIAIPKTDWYYEINGGFTGPISLSMLFIACVEKQIDQNTPVKHAMFGITKLARLPHIVKKFKMHIHKCMQQR
eukprot:CAMPEP_0202709368 /NCGR_PEP_ID=MMETSP1385-20130828/21493_1 /ASSEMBLY_ACC=CAM_ASM_000861 /TAXON_ID=933848 /ORGANISM="Elphidium margaritaceum" /LENGTH=427 /DNA_ID=CAMNT_0049368619 /DNA_START=128 /DNA_END=1411 /DNA_ORIENTATION=+